MIWYIYKLSSSKTRLSYVGMTTRIDKRVAEHLRNFPERFAGGHNFETLSTHSDRREAAEAERQAVINHGTLHPGGYNKREGGIIGEVGYPVSFETRTRLSRAAKARIHKSGWHHTNEAKEKMRASKELYYANNKSLLIGRKKTPEHIAALAKSLKGKTAWNKGRKATAEECAANSLAHMGQVAHNKGVAWSQEIKDRIAEARIAARAARGQPVGKDAISARKRTALKRYDAGLRVLKGTEDCLKEALAARAKANTLPSS